MATAGAHTAGAETCGMTISLSGADIAKDSWEETEP